VRVLATRYGEALRRYGLNRISWRQIIDLHQYGIFTPSYAGRNIVELELDSKYGSEFPPLLDQNDSIWNDPEFQALCRERIR